MRVAASMILLGSVVLSGQSAAGTTSPDGDGFIRDWLVLAPIAIDEGFGSSEVDRDLINIETAMKPAAGDKVSFLGWEWTWKAHTTSEYFIDFRTAFGEARGEDVAGYAVAYVIADADLAVKLAVGSNDEFKAWLNGKPVMKFTSSRALEKDSDTADVTLVRGRNTLVLKVINETNNWQACARFLKDGAGLTNLRISLSAQ